MSSLPLRQGWGGGGGEGKLLRSSHAVYLLYRPRSDSQLTVHTVMNEWSEVSELNCWLFQLHAQDPDSNYVGVKGSLA